MSKETKICNKCNEEKELGEFYFRKDRNNYTSECRICHNNRKNNERKKRNNLKTPEQIKIDKESKRKYDYLYNIDNKEKRSKRNKIYYRENKIKINETNTLYRIKNADKVRAAKKKWKQNNPEKVKISNQKSDKKRRNKIRKKENERRQNDLQFRLIGNLRSRLYSALINNEKNGSAVKDLGCSIKYLKKYLKGQFYSHPDTGQKMTWKNYGLRGWHIDHIIPLAAVDLTDREQLLKVCHYTNLQPLWAKDHYIKSSKDAKIIKGAKNNGFSKKTI